MYAYQGNDSPINRGRSENGFFVLRPYRFSVWIFFWTADTESPGKQTWHAWTKRFSRRPANIVMIDSYKGMRRMAEMVKQEAMIQYNNTKVFFFAHSFKSAFEHAEEFIKRHEGKFEMKVFGINNFPFGEKWRWIRTVRAAPLPD